MLMQSITKLNGGRSAKTDDVYDSGCTNPITTKEVVNDLKIKLEPVMGAIVDQLGRRNNTPDDRISNNISGGRQFERTSDVRMRSDRWKQIQRNSHQFRIFEEMGDFTRDVPI